MASWEEYAASVAVSIGRWYSCPLDQVWASGGRSIRGARGCVSPLNGFHRNAAHPASSARSRMMSAPVPGDDDDRHVAPGRRSFCCRSMPDMPVSWTSTMRQRHCRFRGDATNVSALSNRRVRSPPPAAAARAHARDTASSSMTPTTARLALRPPYCRPRNVTALLRRMLPVRWFRMPASLDRCRDLTASRASSAIEPTSSFWRMFARCILMVRSVICRSAATCLLSCPPIKCKKTSRSRGVSRSYRLRSVC